jgi:arylsulfatase A-like enzyme
VATAGPVAALVALVVALVVAPAVVVVGCSRQNEPPPSSAEPAARPARGDRPTARTPSRRPNVLLISLDTLRADRLGCYGYPRPTSPFLDELAQRGVRFDASFVNTHGTPPSHATLFSSLYQETHRVSTVRRFGKLDHRLPASLPILPEQLQHAGYQTLAVTGGGFMSADFGFDRGFDRFFEEKDIERQTSRLLDEIRQSDDRPIFAFLHTYQIHSPYRPPPAYRSRFVRQERDVDTASKALARYRASDPNRLSPADVAYLSDLYDAGIRYTDDVLRRTFAELEERGFLDHGLVIVTADHGEEFAEHGGLLHPATLFDELVRVPLIVVGFRVPVAKVARRLVSTIDVAPTIYGFTGVTPPPDLEGLDLLKPVPKDASGLVFSQYRDLLLASRTPRVKLVRHLDSGKLELYDLKADPHELRDVANGHASLVTRLSAQLAAWRAACPRLKDVKAAAETDLDAERLEQLRALGYVE